MFLNFVIKTYKTVSKYTADNQAQKRWNVLHWTYVLFSIHPVQQQFWTLITSSSLGTINCKLHANLQQKYQSDQKLIWGNNAHQMTCGSICKQLIEEISTAHTGAVIFDNLWALCPFTIRVTVDTLLHSLGYVSTIVTPRLSNHFTATRHSDIDNRCHLFSYLCHFLR